MIHYRGILLLAFDEQPLFRMAESGGLGMKNVYEVLRQKEMDLTRVRQEVEALRYVAPLLSEQKEDQPQIPEASLGGPRKLVVAEIPASPAELEALKRRA